jgi:hypothetical protein
VSCGLGKLQREILETLDKAERWHRERTGRAMPDGVYDLWNSSRFLAERHGAADGRMEAIRLSSRASKRLFLAPSAV